MLGFVSSLALVAFRTSFSPTIAFPVSRTHVPVHSRKLHRVPALMSKSDENIQRRQAMAFETAIQTSWKSLFRNIQQLRPLQADENYTHQDFLRFFLQANRIYAEGVSQEVEFADTHQSAATGSDPEKARLILADYEAYRRASAGGMSISIFPHFLLNHKPLPSAVWDDEDFQELHLVGSLISGIHNDIFSHGKDDSWDMVNILIKTGSYTEEGAKDYCIARQSELKADFERLQEKLQVRYPDVDALISWMQSMGSLYWSGILTWQSKVKRYEDTNDTRSLLEQLVSSPAESDKMDGSLRDEINEATLRWANETGLVGPDMLSERKWKALNLGLGSLLVHSYVWKDSTDVNQSRRAALTAFAQYLGWIIVVDDVMEDPKVHEHVKRIFLECMEIID